MKFHYGPWEITELILLLEVFFKKTSFYVCILYHSFTLNHSWLLRVTPKQEKDVAISHEQTISGLLMTWWQQSPGHRQPWYWSFLPRKIQGADSIKRCHLTSIGNAIVEIRRSYDPLISTMGFPILVRCHLYIESRPRPHTEAEHYILRVVCVLTLYFEFHKYKDVTNTMRYWNW